MLREIAKIFCNRIDVDILFFLSFPPALFVFSLFLFPRCGAKGRRIAFLIVERKSCPFGLLKGGEPVSPSVCLT
jgi:hypothetical protein